MSEIPIERYNKFISAMMTGGKLFNFEDKSDNLFRHTIYMLNRTQSMFKWSGLPESIPQRILELYLQINGNVCFYQYEGTLYVFRGALGGVPDVYYMPTIYTIANPALDISKNLKIDEDCIVIPNDSMYFGLMPLFNRYASLMAENELSISIATINSRIIDLISAPDDRTKQSAEKFLKDVRDGKLGVISSNEFFEGLKSQPYGTTGNTNAITNLIELEQYLKASWYNELGLNSNYNMKRESLNSEESQLNHDSLLPLVDDMLKQRQEGAERVNNMFGTEITVDYNSAWEDNQIELEIEQQKLEQNQGESVPDESDPDVNGGENDD